MDKTIKQILFKATEKLKESKIPTPHLDAELLLSRTLKRSREHLLSHPEQKIPDLKSKNYNLKIARRCLAEPLAYIIGHKEFYGLDFEVTKDTLIPRPETELMIDEVLNLLRNVPPHQESKEQAFRDKVTAIDVGTGSGNIIISLAKNIQKSKLAQNMQLFAIDSSKKALEIAKRNAKQHDVFEDISFLSGRFLNPLLESFDSKILNSHIVVLANLPYLSKKIYDSSPISVKNFEPKEALFSDNNGLGHYNKLLNQIKMLVTKHKTSLTAFFEISPEQRSLIIQKIKSQFSDADISFKQDLAKKWRLVKISII